MESRYQPPGARLGRGHSGGIPQYVILNLAERTAEEYLDPDPAEGTYGRNEVHPPGTTLRLHLAGDERLDVQIDQLFPPR